jgi:hypothetical protein
MVVRGQTLAFLISAILFSHCDAMQSWPTLSTLDIKTAFIVGGIVGGIGLCGMGATYFYMRAQHAQYLINNTAKERKKAEDDVAYQWRCIKSQQSEMAICSNALEAERQKLKENQAIDAENFKRQKQHMENEYSVMRARKNELEAEWKQLEAVRNYEQKRIEEGTYSFTKYVKKAKKNSWLSSLSASMKNKAKMDKGDKSTISSFELARTLMKIAAKHNHMHCDGTTITFSYAESFIPQL